MNFFARRAPQVAALVVLTACPDGQVRVTRYERRKCTHLGFIRDPDCYEVANVRECPPDAMRRGYLDATEASWDNYGRDPDDKLGVIHQLIGSTE